MTKYKKEFLEFRQSQRSLLDLLDEREMEMSMNIGENVRQAISESIAKSNLSRWQIAGRLGEILQIDFSKSKLDAYSAESKENYKFPAEYLPAFCHATRSFILLETVAAPLRVQILLPQDAKQARLILARMELEKLQKQVKQLEKEANG